ncbi:MAG: hypothetical protein R3C53_24160 [Pirellulaceae bacterium]
MSSGNPYAVPESTNFGQPNTSNIRFPVYTTVMLIVDIVFRLIRMLLVSFSILGVSMMAADDPMYYWGIGEVVTGVLMAVCGLLGDGLVLGKKRIGLFFCWIALLATLGNLVVGLGEIPYMMAGQLADVPADQANAMRIGMWGGAIVMSIFRLALVVAYGVALVMAKRYFDRR